LFFRKTCPRDSPHPCNKSKAWSFFVYIHFFLFCSCIYDWFWSGTLYEKNYKKSSKCELPRVLFFWKFLTRFRSVDWVGVVRWHWFVGSLKLRRFQVSFALNGGATIMGKDEAKNRRGFHRLRGRIGDFGLE
jgi:hypothetical protein